MDARHATRDARVATGIALLALGAAQWSAIARLRNDAFVDEATYIVAGRLQHAAAHGGPPTLPFATFFSGVPALYPQIAASADRVGGLEGARLFSTICIWVASLGVYLAARRLLDDRVAAVAAVAVFAAQAPVMFLARLATFDAPSLALLTLGLAAAVHAAGDGRAALARAALAGALVGAAIGFKYAALLYLPTVALTAALAPAPPDAGIPQPTPRVRIVRGAAVVAGAAAACALIVALAGGRALVDGFLATTVNRAAPSGGSAASILRFAATLGGACAALAVPAIVVRARPSRWLRAALLATALLAPLNHARLHEFVSLHKHVAFGAPFVAVLGGLALARGVWWARERSARGSAVLASSVAAGAAFVLFRTMLLPALQESRRLFAYWPSSAARAHHTLRPLARPGARFLAEEPDVGPYYLSQTAYTQWAHPYAFAYRAGGRVLTGRDAHLAALRDGYFDAVVLRYGPQQAWARAMEAELLEAQPRYRLAARAPFTLADGEGAYDVWVRADAPGANVVR